MTRGFTRALVALAAVALLATLAAPARATTTVLYDGAVAGQTPADQGYFSYQSYPAGAAATATAAAGGTILSSLDPLGDYMGYTSTPPGNLPALTRSEGYTLTFTVQLLAEAGAHPDRAGFSLVLLGDDSKGIELAFWSGEVWAQNDGENDPAPGRGLFTHGEGAALDTTAAPVTYTVVVKDNGYRLLTGGAELLAGPLREYKPSLAEVLANPLRGAYYAGKLIFLGDNTSAAGAEVMLTGVALETVAAAPPPPTQQPAPPPTVAPAPATIPRAYLPAVSR